MSIDEDEIRSLLRLGVGAGRPLDEAAVHRRASQLSARRRWRLGATLALVAAVTLTVAVIGMAPSREQVDMSGSDGEASTAPLPTARESAQMQALIRGSLHVVLKPDGSACVTLQTGDEREVALVWPPGHSLDSEALAVVGPEGERVASDGEQLTLSGGYTVAETPCQLDATWEVSEVIRE